MKTAVIYSRVSSREQAEGFSIDAQIKACKKKAIEERFKLLMVFKDEGYTGTSRDRPALKEMLTFCKEKKVDIVIVHKIDRFARSIVDHSAIRAVLLRNGTNLISCTEQLGTAPHEIFLENIMASMAQFYSDNLKTEVKKGIMERFESGYHLSTAPFGYTVKRGSKVMVQVPSETEVINKIFHLYCTGKYSFKTIAEILDKKYHYETRFGKPFARSRIQEILINPIYAGIVEYKKIGKKVKGLHKPIISISVFNLAQTIMQERGNIKQKEKGKYQFLFKGFVSCPECGKKLYAGYSQGGTGKKYLYYCCRNSNHKPVNIKESSIAGAFQKKMVELRFCDGVMKIVETYAKENLDIAEKQSKIRLANNKKELQKIQEQKADIYKDHKKGLIDESTLKKLESDLEDDEIVAQIAVNEEQIDYNDLLTQIRMFAKFGSQIDRYWEISPFDQRIHILSSMFLNAPTYKNGRLLNAEISPLYKAFKTFSDDAVRYGRGGRT
ncbi:MAG: recombinase family protein [Candidatus Delongbacteria bacterium]|nr:recombinase family protein [Candidatus Delongbacteria bacterium]